MEVGERDFHDLLVFLTLTRVGEHGKKSTCFLSLIIDNRWR